MTVKLNGAGEKHARSLIDEGKVDRDSSWEMTPADEDAILGPDKDWDAYSSWHLGVDDAESEDTKARYKYPFGKGGKVYRSALIAIRQRAGQQGADEIFNAAGELIDIIDDGDKNDDTDDKSGRAVPRVRLEVAMSPWALMPEALAAVLHPSAIRGAVVESRAAGRGGVPRAGAIAVIPVQGVITQRYSWYSCADTTLDDLCAMLDVALADDTIGAILLDIDSPGGSVYGIQEAAAKIQSAQKPVVAIANSLAASAAYWLGCAADAFYCTPGGEVGSIGVWQAHMDYSRLLDEAGISTTLISAGKYKVEGNPYQPLDADAQAFMQSRVDDYYAAFTQAVAKNRKVPIASVRDGMGQGRVLGASAAKAEGMIDDVLPFDDVVSLMQKNMRAGAHAARGASAPAAGASQPRLAAARRALHA